MGVASGCGEQEVGVASGCGCKEVYRFPHTTYPYSSCIIISVFFCSSIPTFCSLKKKKFLQYTRYIQWSVYYSTASTYSGQYITVQLVHTVVSITVQLVHTVFSILQYTWYIQWSVYYSTASTYSGQYITVHLVHTVVSILQYS